MRNLDHTRTFVTGDHWLAADMLSEVAEAMKLIGESRSTLLAVNIAVDSETAKYRAVVTYETF